MCSYEAEVLVFLIAVTRFNLSQLEDWVRLNQLEGSGIVEALETITQATQLLQVNKKTLEDVDAICEVCSSLNTLQVREPRSLSTTILCALDFFQPITMVQTSNFAFLLSFRCSFWHPQFPGSKLVST